jgi:hypothetical protein
MSSIPAGILLRLLMRQKQGDNIDPSMFGDVGNDPGFNVPSGPSVDPKFTVPPPSNVQDQSDPELDRIRSIFSQEPQGVTALRKHLNSMPTEDDPAYKAGLGRKILGVLAGVGQELSTAGRGGHPDVAGGIHVADDIIHDKYNTAIKDWSRRTGPLENVAALDEKSQYGRQKGEEAVQNIRTRREIANQTAEQRREALDETHQRNMASAKNDEERRAEIARHNKEMEGLKADATAASRENAANRGEPGVWVDDENGNPIYKPRSQAYGSGKLGGTDQAIVSSAKQVQTSISNLRNKLTPEVIKKIGKVKGSWGEITQKLGLSKDKDLMDVSREMSTLELQHPKIFGLRASNMTMEKVAKLFGNISQQPEGFLSSLDVMNQNADDAIKSRLPGYKGTKGNPPASGKKPFIIEEDK